MQKPALGPSLAESLHGYTETFSRRDKVEGFVEGWAGCPAEMKEEGFGPNQPGPPGFGLAVRPRHQADATTSTFAISLADRFAKQETE